MMCDIKKIAIVSIKRLEQTSVLTDIPVGFTHWIERVKGVELKDVKKKKILFTIKGEPHRFLVKILLSPKDKLWKARVVNDMEKTAFRCKEEKLSCLMRSLDVFLTEKGCESLFANKESKTLDLTKELKPATEIHYASQVKKSRRVNRYKLSLDKQRRMKMKVDEFMDSLKPTFGGLGYELEEKHIDFLKNELGFKIFKVEKKAVTFIYENKVYKLYSFPASQIIPTGKDFPVWGIDDEEAFKPAKGVEDNPFIAKVLYDFLKRYRKN